MITTENEATRFPPLSTCRRYVINSIVFGWQSRLHSSAMHCYSSSIECTGAGYHNVRKTSQNPRECGIFTFYECAFSIMPDSRGPVSHASGRIPVLLSHASGLTSHASGPLSHASGRTPVLGVSPSRAPAGALGNYCCGRCGLISGRRGPVASCLPPRVGSAPVRACVCACLVCVCVLSARLAAVCRCGGGLGTH